MNIIIILSILSTHYLYIQDGVTVLNNFIIGASRPDGIPFGFADFFFFFFLFFVFFLPPPCSVPICCEENNGLG